MTQGSLLTWAVLLAIVAGGVLFVILSPRVAEALLFFPDRGDAGPPPVLAGVQGEAVILSQGEGAEVVGWWYPAAPPAGGAPGSGSPSSPALHPPAVLFFHGNAGHLGHRTFQVEGMLREGVSVFLAGYRGYAGGAGRPALATLLPDARLAWEAVAERAGGGHRVVVHGRSLGGAVAAGLAAELLEEAGPRPGGSRVPGTSPEEDTPADGVDRAGSSTAEMPAGIVLESTFTSLRQMARTVYPLLPGILTRALSGYLDTEEALSRLAGDTCARPVGLLVIHGEADTLVPAAMGEALQARAEGEGPPCLRAVEMVRVAGAGHNDLPLRMGDAYFAAVAAFVREAVAFPPAVP